MKLNHRLTVLISLMQELENYISDQNIHKLLFIYCHKYACNSVYDFILVDNNPYCITIYEDKKFLINKELLVDTSSWVLNQETFRFAKNLDMIEKLSLQKLKNDLEKGLIIDDLIDENYAKYFKSQDIDQQQVIFYTIGYEGLNLEQYLNKLLKHQIACLCDVRRNPYSQKFGFSKAELIHALSIVNIEYIHIPDLGISSVLRQNIKNDSDYYNLLKHYETDILSHQSNNIKLLKDLLAKYRKLAITCFEAKISHCHRSKIANLIRREYMVRHI